MFLESAYQEYLNERSKLSEKEIDNIFDKGKVWDLSSTFAKKGSAVFPHTYLKACGDQVAAVIQGCFNSGSDQVLVLGAVHPINKDLIQARQKEFDGLDISHEPSHGIFGEDVASSRIIDQEFSLLNFTFLWNEACKRKITKPPKLIIRYPSLVAARPEKLKGDRRFATVSKRLSGNSNS